jgi:hypothetical protein
MCTYVTETLPVTGSAKGADGWFRVTDASVYYDHPVHALAEHTLNVDLRRPADGPGARVAVELTPAAARDLATAILRVLDETGRSEATGVESSR